jgi:recombination protein RecT
MNDIIEAKDVYQIVEFQEQAFSHMLTDDAISWAKESQFALQMLQSNQYLNDAAWKNKASLKNAIINVASIGISLNPALKHAYLVPRSVKKGAPAAICLDISYMGLMHLAQQTGSILWGQAKIVYAGDQYENTGIDSAPSHKSNPFKPNKDRGEVIGAYCTVKTSDGSYLTEEMNIDELNKIRDSSKASNGPWKTWPEEMMRKSVVKRASKYWPKVARLNQAVDVINQHEGIDFQEEKDITPARQNPHQDLDALLAARRADPAAFLPWMTKLVKREITIIADLSDDEANDIIKRMENAS